MRILKGKKCECVVERENLLISAARVFSMAQWAVPPLQKWSMRCSTWANNLPAAAPRYYWAFGPYCFFLLFGRLVLPTTPIHSSHIPKPVKRPQNAINETKSFQRAPFFLEFNRCGTKLSNQFGTTIPYSGVPK